MIKTIYKKIAIFLILFGSIINEIFAINVNALSGTHGIVKIQQPPSINLELYFALARSLQFIIFIIFLTVVIGYLVIYPYNYYKTYKILTSEEKEKLSIFVTIEKYIAHGVLFTVYSYFFILLFTLIQYNTFYYRIVDFTKGYIIPIIIIHYIILLISGIYMYHRGFKDSGKKILQGVHVFLGVNLFLCYVIVLIFRSHI